MKVVVKIGGAALEEKSIGRSCAQAVAELAADGHQVAVVHGGGATLTRVLLRMGKKSEFVNGLRVTDAETRDAAVMVLAGIINKALVAELVTIGQPAVGICGGDGLTFLARKKKSAATDLGFVGEICSVDLRWIQAIWSAGGVPVICSVALGADGQYYNVNADQMASACAIACHADALIFLTDVGGVTDANGAVIRWLPVQQISGLVKDAVVAGGMLPKLDACQEALRRGVGRVCIVPSLQARALQQFYFSKLECGTEVISA